MSNDQRWWQTLPGMMTAGAAIITAVGGLLAILLQYGVIDPDGKPKPLPDGPGPQTTALPQPVTTPPAALTSPQLKLSKYQVRIGETYFATASGFLPGENVRFSWTGPTNGEMCVVRTDSSGSTTCGGIVKDPPGTYVITAIGEESRRTASADLIIQPGS